MPSIPDNLQIAKQDLEILNYLKSDGMGAVFKGVWTRTEGKLDVAIKMIRTRGQEVLTDIFHELQVMAGLNYSNICHIHGACLVSDKEVWLVMELADGNLKDFITSNKLSTFQQISFALQAALSLAYLHNLSTPVLHRDITSRSILVQNKSKILLSGFGLAKTFSFANMETESFGSIRWSPPEVLEGKKKWSEKSDIYSLGMVFYEIVSGKLPYQEEDWNFDKIMNKIKSGTRPKIPKECPKEFAKIIKKCWQSSPKSRPTAKELVGLLQACPSFRAADAEERKGSFVFTCG